MNSDSINNMYSNNKYQCSPYVFIGIAKYLSYTDITNLSNISDNMRQIIQANEFLFFTIKRILNDIMIRNRDILVNLNNVSKDYNCTQTNCIRVRLLINTICELNAYIIGMENVRPWLLYNGKYEFSILLGSIYEKLHIIQNTIKQMTPQTEQLFDIFELSIKKAFYEISTLFPIESEKFKYNFSEHIHDNIAQHVWDTQFGKTCIVIEFKKFINVIVSTWNNGTSEVFIKHIEYLFNFPKDDIITVYRFNLMSCLFGPYNNISDNLHNWVIRKNSGFVGYMNIVGADKILTNLLPQLQRHTILLRFSRREPELFAITEINIVTKAVTHYRNIDRFGQRIPIDTYIKRMFPQHDIAKLNVDPEILDIGAKNDFSRISKYMIVYGY